MNEAKQRVQEKIAEQRVQYNGDNMACVRAVCRGFFMKNQPQYRCQKRDDEHIQHNPTGVSELLFFDMDDAAWLGTGVDGAVLPWYNAADAQPYHDEQEQDE